MFDVGAAELLLIALVLGLALVAFAGLHQWVNVNQRWHVSGRGIELEQALLTTLSSISGRRAVNRGHGRISLTQRRTPLWTVVLAVLTFPLGLLFLLIKVEQTLTVLITPHEHGGSRVDVIGVTRSHTRDALARALVTEHSADAEALGVRL